MYGKPRGPLDTLPCGDYSDESRTVIQLNEKSDKDGKVACTMEKVV